MRFLQQSPGRVSGEERVVLGTDNGERAGWGLWFTGRRASGIRPWADLYVTDTSVLPEVAAELGPGASLMVAYEADETERCLRRRIPPAATPLGMALLRAGCSWFKDWYFPEGGREGGTKLQGTLPLHEEHRRKAYNRLISELEHYVTHRAADEHDRERARAALRVLGAATHTPSREA